jgi:putative pyruvate formate lyase activating enzyme
VGESGIYKDAEEKVLTLGKPVAQFFFSHCNLSCVFCSNSGISIYGYGHPYSIEALADKIMEYNSNDIASLFYVTPEPFLPWIAESIESARKRGADKFSIYVSSGYINPALVDDIKRIFDSFVISLKPADPVCGMRFTGAEDYWENIAIVLEKLSLQQGSDVLPALLIRILILPGKVDIIINSLDKLSKVVPLFTPLHIMKSFYPCHKWESFGEYRDITRYEYKLITEYANKLGFEKLVE